MPEKASPQQENSAVDDDSSRGPGRRRGRRRSRRRRKPRKLNLGKTLFVLPNAVTLAAVFCGFNAIQITADAELGEGTEDFYRAAILLLFSMFFDLMDGRVARMTRTQSAFGLQLDSLADIISFGVAPALLVYRWVLYRFEFFGLLSAFAFVACAAVRLARFNVLSSADSGAPKTPGKYIVGLPSPPASGVLISLVVANHAMEGALGDPRYGLIILTMTVVIGLLMVSNVKFRSFKDLKFNGASIALIIFVFVSSAFVWRRFTPTFVFVWLLGFYLLIGVFETLRNMLSRPDEPQTKPKDGESSA